MWVICCQYTIFIKYYNKLYFKFKIRTQGADQVAQFLSGGNQQKVILAKWFYTEADIFIFDESTKGIDIGAKEDIYIFREYAILPV